MWDTRGVEIVSHSKFLTPLVLLLLTGCATSFNPATQQQETLLISSEQEIRLGEALSKQVEKEYKPLHDPELLARLDRVGERLVAGADRRDLLYHFNIVEEKEPNAFALPGGPIYVTSGLLKMVQSDDELAAVLGHEIGHVTARHAVKRLQAALGLQLLEALAVGTRTADGTTREGMDLAFVSILTAYSQQDELQADRLGVRYLKRAGYQPLAAIDFLTRLRDYTYKQPIHQFSYFRTHPYFADRIRAVRAEATGQIQFDDYINRAQ